VIRWIAVAAIAGCGSPPPRVELPETKPPIVVAIGHTDVTNDLAVRSEDVTFKVGDRSPARSSSRQRASGQPS